MSNIEISELDRQVIAKRYMAYDALRAEIANVVADIRQGAEVTISVRDIRSRSGISHHRGVMVSSGWSASNSELEYVVIRTESEDGRAIDTTYDALALIWVR